MTQPERKMSRRKSLTYWLAASSLLLVVSGCSSGEGSKDTDDTAGTIEMATARLAGKEALQLNVLEDGDCPPYRQADLQEPTKIYPVGGVLETQLIVALQDRCVPVFTKDVGWTLERLSLRTYGFPRDHSRTITGEQVEASLDDPNMVWSAPGPTFVLNKASAPGKNDGTNFKMTLFNALEPQEDPHACNELIKKGDPPTGPFHPDTSPNCFHGDNSTNFHFHGFHVSPQPHQDFVGLELLPFGSGPILHATHGARGVVAEGEYSYDVDRIRYTQAEGTHWYHAHKHGSTALQVINGLVGTFEIYGEFDRQLEALFSDQGGLPQRLLVVQQLQQTLSGLGNNPSGPPSPLINGQADPIVRMKPGEIQRWRFVGATMQDSATLDIHFEGTSEQPEVRQVAMDGVQFAPQNYACQPILFGPDCETGTEDDSFSKLTTLTLAPGNRIDLLVKAPAIPGRYSMTYEIAGNLDSKAAIVQQARIAELLEHAKKSNAALAAPPLLTVVVEGTPGEGVPFPSEADFPKLPDFLADLQGPFKPRTVGYEMTDQGNLEKVHFSINGKQYSPDCVNETLTLDVAEEWTLTNNSGIAHPFHIHTNPFQVVSDGALTYNAPYVWRDVIPIPVGSVTTLGEAVIRYVAREFTGEFVNHCHILGHEDRGMMHNVQVICPPSPENDWSWGKPTDNLSDECRDGNYIPAAPACSV